MDWPSACAAIVPCLNEGGTIGPLVTEVSARLREVIVVDDGSTDQTAAVARRAGARVLCLARNNGKGAALRAGLTEAFQRGLTWAITLDGDGQHRPADLPLFFECAERTGAALVIGDRMHRAQAMPWLRRQANRGLSWLLSRRTRQTLADSQCGFRLIHLGSWAALRLEADHFEVESEMLCAFLAAGHRVRFVPIEVVGRGRQSKVRPLADGWRWWRWWWRSRRREGRVRNSVQPA